MSIEIRQGDSRDILAQLADASVDACVCDPPYDLKFMGKHWDTGDTAHDPAFWREVYRVLKPGAHVVAFAGTRTYHRLACAIEDAGFEIRDMVAWLYGAGFPKSHDVSKAIDKAAGATRRVVGQSIHGSGPDHTKLANHATGDTGIGSRDGSGKVFALTAPATPDAAAWDGWGTALKPALEPIVLARKPLGERTVAANVLAHGTGALNVDACRIDASGRPARVIDPKPEANGAVYAGRQSAGHGFDGGSKAVGTTDLGRWPANVCLSYPEDEYELSPYATAEQRREIYRWLSENA